jgi:hypothetical protein
MDRITDTIWIGNYLDAADTEARSRAGIRSILCLDGCMEGATAGELGVEDEETWKITA